MSLSGSGIGGNIGGSQTPLQREIETTAWTEVNKAALGIVRDSIQQIFTDANPRYNFGYLGGFGYRSSSEQPLLDHPLESVRMLASFQKLLDEGWKGEYQELFNQLPEDLQERFLYQMTLPPEERNSAYVVLDQVLTVVAKTLHHISLQPQTPIGPVVDRTLLNILLPFAFLKSSIDHADEIGVATQKFIEMQGPNYRDFDTFSHMLTQLESALDLLERINNTLGHTPDGELSAESKADAAKVAAFLDNLGSKLEQMVQGNDLQLLSATFSALKMAANSMALPHTGSAPLFFSLYLSTIGLEGAENQTGLLGPTFSSLVKAIGSGLSDTPSTNESSSQLLFEKSLIATLSVAIGLASIVAENGIGTPATRDPDQLQETNSLALATALNIVMGSGFIQTFLQEIISLSGGTHA